MPITAIALSISLLALAGLPPLNGFWSKLVIFGAGINSGPLVEWGPWLAIAGVLNSALSLGYYAWIMRKMYMEESPNMERVREPRAMVAVMMFGVIFMVGFGIWHAPILEFASEALPNFSETMISFSANSTSNTLTPLASTNGSPSLTFSDTSGNLLGFMVRLD